MIDELCACQNGLKIASGVVLTAVATQALLLSAMALATVVFASV